MISIRQLLFGVFATALASGAIVATTSDNWAFHIPTALFALFFLGYVTTVGILSVYSERQKRPFWNGCLITVVVLLVGSSLSPISASLSVYEEIAQTVNRTIADRMAADILRENAYRVSIIIRLGVMIILSLAGGSFAIFASRRIRSQG